MELSPLYLYCPCASSMIGVGQTYFSSLFSAQRQRLRELLIRQQIQRNTLRQEKETAAAAAGAVGPLGSWGAESSSPAFEQLSRGQTPFAGTQDKSSLVGLPPSKLSGPILGPGAFPSDDRLSRPPPPATPSSMDVNSR